MSSPGKEFSIQRVSSIENEWNDIVRETIDAYMSIPCVSLSFDAQWKETGHIDKASSLYEKWAKEFAPNGSKVYVQRIENKTPLLIIDVPAREYNNDDCVLLYGHLDKQPEMAGWDVDKNPFAATYIGDRLYGRGGADDGYAMFSAVLALRELDKTSQPHARCVVVIEASEESGSPDLADHLSRINETLETQLSNVTLVVCLDSGCLTYDHLWVTRSLRGLIHMNVSVRVLNQGMHSGGAGGIVPSTTHVFRSLLDRVVTSPEGYVLIDELNVDIRADITEAAASVAGIIGSVDAHGLAFADGVRPIEENVTDQIIANTYKPQLEIIGIDGIPSTDNAGNVLLPAVTYSLSFRIPPGVDPEIGAGAIAEKFLTDIPYDAQVTVVVESLASGWEAPQQSEWLHESLTEASLRYFGSDVQYMGEGGTIPFMSMLGEQYPEAQFLVTGVLGPGSNAHGPNEFLDLPTAYKVTACVSDAVHAHSLRNSQESPVL